MGKVCRGLKGIRESRLMTQQELADASGISRLSIGKAEKGKGMALSTVREFAKALNVKPEKILGV